RAWMRAVDANGGGPWSAANFAVASPLAAPVITAPAGAVANPPTVAWQAVPGAATYQLRIDDLTTHTDYAVWQGSLTGTSFTVTTLVPGHSYRAWLHGVDANGGGPWSASNFAVSAGAGTPAASPAPTAGAATLAVDPTDATKTALFVAGTA